MEDSEVLREVIQLYKSYRILWDAKHSGYYNKRKREDAWREISLKTDVPVNDLKKKMTSLLGSYRREKSREKKSVVIGSGTDNVYKSKWFAYTWFRFLSDKDVPTNTTDTIDNDVTSDLSQEIPENVNAGKSTVAERTTSTSQSGELRTVREFTLTPASVQPSQRTKKRRISIEDKSNVLHDAYKILKKTSEAISDDHYDSFGIYVANELRKYDTQTLPFVKKAILDVLFQADIGEFSQTHRGYYTTGYCNTNASTSTVSSPLPSPSLHSANLTPTPHSSTPTPAHPNPSPISP